jgi:predicted RNA-binding Zn-ribbon protein involved in translation (DUF1610 family)
LTVEAAFVMNMIRSRKKPHKCPECGSWRIAGILYGMPSMDARLERDLEAGRIVLGGCVVTDPDPTWQCTDCGTQIYRET